MNRTQGHKTQDTRHKYAATQYSILNTQYSERLSIVLIFFLLCSTLTGCAAVTDGVKKFAGISTRSLEEGRKNAIKKTFSYDYFTCYNMSLDALKHMYAYIYKADVKGQMIAAYISREDTTPVGLFFTWAGENSTQVEVSSPSTYAREFIFGKIFLVLDKKITLGELGAQINAKKKEEEESRNK